MKNNVKKKNNECFHEDKENWFDPKDPGIEKEDLELDLARSDLLQEEGWYYEDIDYERQTVIITNSGEKIVLVDGYMLMDDN